MANEKRLIDANELVSLMKYYDEQQRTDMWETSEIEHLLGEISTVDAVEVVHGQWFSLTDCSNAGVYCSICHKKVWKEDYAWCNRKNKLRSNYCPNCGAKMDGDGDG